MKILLTSFLFLIREEMSNVNRSEEFHDVHEEEREDDDWVAYILRIA
jgi:hypothetical protein